MFTVKKAKDQEEGQKDRNYPESNYEEKQIGKRGSTYQNWMVDKVHQLLDETISNSNSTRWGTKEQQYTPTYKFKT